MNTFIFESPAGVGVNLHAQKKLSMDEKEKKEPAPVQLSLNKAGHGRICVQRKRETGYTYRAEPSNTVVGPYDLSLLHLWVVNGLIPESLQVYEGQSTTPIVLSDLLREKGLDHAHPDASEWFLWTDSKTPFQNASQRISKYFMCRSQRKDQLKAVSIVFQKKEVISLNTYQDFGDFLAQYFEESWEGPTFHLNEMGEPLARWVHKTISGLGAPSEPEQIRKMVLEDNPEVARRFFLQKIDSEQEALKVFAEYNRWRLFLPVYDMTC